MAIDGDGRRLAPARNTQFHSEFGRPRRIDLDDDLARVRVVGLLPQLHREANVLGIDRELKPLIKPGDRVDVLVTFEAVMADGRKERVTATILQNVLVIAVGTNLGQGMNAKQAKAATDKEDKTAAFSVKAMIALALNPNEAQYLSLAIKQGDTTVILRGLGDVEMHPMEMASFRKLFK